MGETWHGQISIAPGDELNGPGLGIYGHKEPIIPG